MTPARLEEIIEHCRRERRKASRMVFHREIAEFLGIEPVTLRRWLRGARPVPRMAEVIFEILYGWPEIQADAVNRVIALRDEAGRTAI